MNNELLDQELYLNELEAVNGGFWGAAIALMSTPIVPIAVIGLGAYGASKWAKSIKDDD
jgi:uncharacterized membrane protein